MHLGPLTDDDNNNNMLKKTNKPLFNKNCCCSNVLFFLFLKLSQICMLNKCQRAYSANARKLILLMPQRHTNISFLFKTTRKNEHSIKQNEHAKTNWLNIFTYIKSETQHFFFITFSALIYSYTELVLGGGVNPH